MQTMALSVVKTFGELNVSWDDFLRQVSAKPLCYSSKMTGLSQFNFSPSHSLSLSLSLSESLSLTVSSSLPLSLSLYIYIYVCVCIHKRGSLNKFPDFFFVWALLLEYTHEILVPFEVISSACNALVVPFQ